MRHTTCRGAVFTPAFPNLEAFLKQHIDPDHPLRHHPLWITEGEMKQFQIDCSAARRNHSGIPPTVVMKVPYLWNVFNADQIMPDSEICWQLPPVDVPMSLRRKVPFMEPIKSDLQKVKEMHKFQSNWWATRFCWRENGALIKPRAVPTLLRLNISSTLVHISLVSNAQEVLKQSYISGKTGFFKTWFNSGNSNNELFSRAMEAHVEKHGFQTPLYFSAPSLQRAGIGVHPNAEPLDLSTAFNCDYESFPVSGDFSDSRKVATYEQFYHLSQVIFPDCYEVPMEVQAAERLHPGVPVSGVSGHKINRSELYYDTLVQSNVPELAGLVRGDESTMLLTTDLSSPREVEGRSVWFKAAEVLELGGKVDVNAVPVEVLVKNSQVSPYRVLYNVDQLLAPVEGYKAVGSAPNFALPKSELSTDF